jgi:hypothetical protein
LNQDLKAASNATWSAASLPLSRTFLFTWEP